MFESLDRSDWEALGDHFLLWVRQDTSSRRCRNSQMEGWRERKIEERKAEARGDGENRAPGA